MLSILRKVNGLTCRDLYFYHEFPDRTIGEDIQFFLQSTKLSPDAEPFFTLIIDLTLEEELLSKAIKKRVSYEIRRAKDKDLVVVSVFNAPNYQDINKFSLFYDAFSNSKNLTKSNKQKLLELAKNSALVLSTSSVDGDDTNLLSTHAYICDGKRARLLYSASNVTLRLKEERQLIGRANRYMHWYMMCHFREKNFSEYDFGGISELPELKNINEFKKEFGGRELLEYNLLRGISIKGRVAVLIFHLKKKLDKIKNFLKSRYKNF